MCKTMATAAKKKDPIVKTISDAGKAVQKFCTQVMTCSQGRGPLDAEAIEADSRGDFAGATSLRDMARGTESFMENVGQSRRMVTRNLGEALGHWRNVRQEADRIQVEELHRKLGVDTLKAKLADAQLAVSDLAQELKDNARIDREALPFVVAYDKAEKIPTSSNEPNPSIIYSRTFLEVLGNE